MSTVLLRGKDITTLSDDELLDWTNVWEKGSPTFNQKPRRLDVTKTKFGMAGPNARHFYMGSKRERGLAAEELRIRESRVREKAAAREQKIKDEAASVETRDQFLEAGGMRTRFAGQRQGASLQRGSASRILLGG